MLAGLVSVLSSLVAIMLLHHARAASGRVRAMWFALAGMAAGCGMWAAHFIALLAYSPGVPLAFNLGLTGLSLVAVMIVATVGLTFAVTGPARWAAPAGGAIVGLGIAMMHYTGMSAMELPGQVAWATDLVAASILLSLAFGVAAMSVMARWTDLRGTLGAATLLSLSTCVHHFTAMGAINIIPDPERTIAPSSLSEPTLAFVVATITVAILGMTLVGSIAGGQLAARKRQFAQARQQIIQASEEKLREKHLQLDTALNNMSQGLVMFDKDLRLAVCNRRYLEMYRMPLDLAEARPTLQEVLEQHYSRGMFHGNPRDYVDSILKDVKTDQAVTRTVETADGRIVSIVNRHLPDGGRIATHEDITERHKLHQAHAQAEAQLREQKFQLDAALNNMSQGLCMFDAEGRLLVSNRRFIEMYKLSTDVVKPGCTFLNFMKHRKEVGLLQVDPEERTRAIIESVAQGRTETWIIPSADGRVTRAFDQPMPGGGWVTTHEDITEQRQAEEQVRDQKLKLEAALDNMSQGLVMFDRNTRLILVNKRYLEMYNLSADQVTPGTTFLELMKLRRAAGLLDADPEEHAKKILASVAQGRTETWIIPSTDGRITRAQHQPMADGGWVTTHEDITEQRRAEEQVRDQKFQLDTALANMTHGLVMFDGNTRLILCNKRYLEMYGLSADQVKPGILLWDLLALRQEQGTFSRDAQSYIAELKEVLAAGKSFYLNTELSDGRVISVANQPMPGGGWVSTHEDITEGRRADEQLRKQKLQLDTALNNMSQGLNLFDSDGRLVVWNERYLEMYRLSPDRVKAGATVRDLVQARIEAGTFFDTEPDQYVAELMRTMHRREPTNSTKDLPDGRTIVIIGRPTPDGHGWVVTHEDITDRRRAETERDRSQAFASTVIENVPATIIVKDARDLRYVLINRAGEKYYNITREQMIGKTGYDIFPKRLADMIAGHDEDLLRTGEPIFMDEHPSKTPSGEDRIITTVRTPIRNPKGDIQYLLTVVEDRTHRQRAEAQIAHMAHHDSLTGLPNRVAFMECLNSTIEAAAKGEESFALMSLDLDRFKEINDVFGHSVGDGLLREMSRRLQEAVGGAFLARLGGDEFMIIATDGKQPAAAEALADRLLAAVADEFTIDVQRLRSGLSIGVAVYPVDGGDAETLVANADAALYRSKAEGRGAYRFFEAGMDERLRERRVLQQELSLAVEREELTLNYQPQAKISGDITGFEALVRWRHPTRGVISPGTFIPLAEESALIVPLGEWILREACRQAASWPKPLGIAVNLSPVQFRHGDLVALVHSVLLETGLAPSRLELEITEGVLSGDFSRAVSILRRLKGLGVKIAMDDFGTGYSSLSYLQSFPFDKIKIDQAFISNLESNEQSATIIRAVIGLARGLSLPVIAEGVETKGQLAFLAAEKCDEVQGYLIGKPRPIEDYAELTGQPNKRPKLAAVAS